MAILRGTSQSRFPPFDDPNIGAGFLIERGQRATLNFLKRIEDGIFESKFVEDGVQNIPGFSTIDRSFSQIKQSSRRQILTQRPQATIFIKKRMFSTLRSNYDIRFLGQKEKLFMKAAKLLFERKAQELSFYESLIRIESIFDSDGFLAIDRSVDGAIASLLQVLTTAFDGFSIVNGRQFSVDEIVNQATLLTPFARVVGDLLKMQEANRRSKGNEFTTWVVDPRNPDVSGVGPGVGVIELNLVSDFDTTVSIDTGGGGASLTIEDPYRISVISDSDIEIALGEAIAQQDVLRGSVRTVGNDLLQRAEALDVQLNESRVTRGKSQVNFEFQLQTNKVIGTVVETAEEFDLFTIDLISEEQSLSTLEKALAKEIMVFLNGFHSLDQRNINLFQTLNDEFNDVRQRLRNEFVGHSIIQQMDMVHVFVNSKTRDDTPNSEQGFDTSALLGNLQVQGDLLDTSAVKTEWEQVAPNVPFTFYLAMRNRSQWRSDGVQVFSGLVNSVMTSYDGSNGKFTLKVGCSDNTEFLQLGRFNQNPSLAQPGGLINDPLTPFNLNIDPATGLVASEPKLSDENIRRLPYMRYDDGIMAGQRVTEGNIYQDKQVGGRVLTFQHAPGLIYKWKEGMIAETLNVNTRKPLSGRGSTLADVVEVYGVTTLDNPFAGLDAADVISILVTGRPHNYSTFLRHALDVGTFTIDNTNSNKFYFNYLFDFLERQAHVLGDFVPAKPSIVSPAVAAAAFREKKRLDGFNRDRQTLERQLAQLDDQIASQSGGASAAQQEERQRLQIRRAKLENQLVDSIANATENINVSGADAAAVSLSVVGNDLLLSFDDAEIEFNKRAINYLIGKKPEDVRYNLDKNFLVVSDQYDSDLDIQAFARNLKQGGPELFKSTYQAPIELCKTAADTVGFEFFADSQGNLIFRPPEYNKTPLTLLLKLLALKNTEGVGYVPEFLHNLFKSRSKLIEDQLTIIELQILEKIVLLGQPTQSVIEGVGVNDFSLSVETTDGGRTWILNVQKLEEQLNREILFSFTEQQALRNRNQEFAPADFAEALVNIRNNINNLLGRTDLVKRPEGPAIEEAKQELSQFSISKNSSASVNRLGLVNKIAQLVSKRQLLGRAYLKIKENARDFNLIESGNTGESNLRNELPVPSSVAAQLQGVTVADIPTFPRFMEALIENNLTNEEGFRSGKRFIIMDDVIIRMDLQVTTPRFNQIEVTGNQDFISGGNREGELGGIPKVLWAGATDFDSWRQFGFRADQPIFRPDFVNPETQCAPYAIFKLQEERRKIHQGSIVIMGNEFYQAGDVVYINNRSMLYYVTAVKHRFDFSSGQFTTTLDLAYGRALGEYIPTTLDIIGKGLLANQRRAFGNIASNRSSVSANHAVFLETLFLPEYTSVTSGIFANTRNEFINRDQNKERVKNAIRKASARINKKKQGDVRIEVRTYFVDGPNGTLDKARQMGQWVCDMITGEITNPDNENSTDLKFEKENVVRVPPININRDIDIGEREEKLRRFPSAQAWSGLNPFVTSEGVGLPLNAIDIFFVAEKSRFGDQDPIKLSEDGTTC